ncbi:MAG: Arylsulfate sulfotransferase AssT [Verrucomicrobiae bacterium]|nr:Arylsulfate sulfotransferase AssT [Verrucomicrobiae bacterium]
MKQLLIGLIATVLTFTFSATTNAAAPAVVTINGQSAGPTPFISQLDLTVSQASALAGIEFMVEPKPGSATRPVSASYSTAYLQSRGFFDTTNGQINLPVFGLYADYSNTVVLTYLFNKGSAQTASVTIPTAAFADPTGVYTNPTIVQARSLQTKDLSYDFVMLKQYASSNTPVIVDTDGEVRWVGTAGIAIFSSIFYDNAFYVASGTGLVRNELDGAFGFIADYSNLGVTTTGHHNYDPGKFGIILEVDTTNAIESVNIEIDRLGNVLKVWNVADIIRDAMIAGGDDPSAFVREPDDWFHNNATTYRKSDNTIIMSGREDFVIAFDYDTQEIKWILGDSSKAWYQYPSLRQFAVTLGKDTLPPIGQHAVSITKDNSLLLFDNGATSLNHTPPGTNRTYSAARKYKIKSLKKPAREVWTYDRNQTINSPYCSSVYEDRAKNYLVTYSMGGPFVYTKLVGLSSKGAVVFEIDYPAINGCGTAWNAIPIHLENLVFE